MPRSLDLVASSVKKCAAPLVAFVFLLFASHASADTLIGGAGTGAGQYEAARGVAVDKSNGTVYVADQGNRRIDVFEADGDFTRAFGWGVVASGPGDKPRNEREQVTVNATGGTFALRFIQNNDARLRQTGEKIKQESAAIPVNAPASTVQIALESMVAIEPGDVSVSGPAGGPWTVEFTGSYADTDVHVLEGMTTGLTGGAQSVTVTTTQLGANYEVCEPANGDVCRVGQLGVLPGQLNPTSVAVDNDPASPSYHDVYVFDGLESSSTNEDPNNRVQKFTPEGDWIWMAGGGVNKGPLHPGNLCTATHVTEGDSCGGGSKGTGAGQFNTEVSGVEAGPDGTVYVADGERVQKFELSGVHAGQFSIPGAGTVITADSTGNIYVVSEVGVIEKYDPSGSLLDEISVSGGSLQSNVLDIGIDSLGDIFVPVAGFLGVIFRYDSSGTLKSVIYPEQEKLIEALDLYTSPGGDILALERNRFGNGIPGLIYIPFPPPGPVALKGAAETVRSATAKLTARVNPEGKSTTYHFEYVDDESFKDEGYASTATKTTAESAPIGSDFALYNVNQPVTGLTPETLYHFRVVASNADGVDKGIDATFETLPPITMGDAWASEVGIDTAKLSGQANPNGIPASGYFEYVDDATYQASVAAEGAGHGFDEAVQVPDVDGGASPLDLGSGEALATVKAQVFPLEPQAIYHYRFVGQNAFKTVTGPEQLLRTFAPLSGAEDTCANSGFRGGLSASLPDCRAYEMVSPVDKAGGDIISPSYSLNYPLPFYQASEDGDGLTYTSLRAFGNAQSSPYASQYLARRGSEGWSTDSISPPQGFTISEGDTLDNHFLAATADLGYGWFFHNSTKPITPDAPEGFDNLYRRDNSDGTFKALNTVIPPHPKRNFRPRLQGVSADGGTAVFIANDNLTEDASTKSIFHLYVASEEGLRLAGVLPNGTANQNESSAGTGGGLSTGMAQLREESFTHALSDDASRLYWTSSTTGGSGTIYLRLNPTREQSAIEGGACTESEKACTVPVSGLITSEPARFLTAAANGSRAVFTIGSRLYVYDAEAKQATEIADSSLGVLGTSEDASRVYFAATKVMSAGASAGQRNVYLYEEGAGTSFVTVLGGSGTGDAANFVSGPRRLVSRVSPDGTHLLMLSERSLTGYDNADAATGKPNSEAYLYGIGEGIVCVSCNPTLGRPTGKEINANDPDRRLYAENSPFVALGSFAPGWQSALYARRTLSEDGSRVFFNSFDSLTPRDSNGTMDVYQWERLGSGSCTEQSPDYSPFNEGCISLISSGQSPEYSEFVDASPDGRDVFFTTSSSLLPQDDGLIDIYDARAGGGYPPPPTPTPSCEGEACQGPLSPPEDPTPASSTFQGAGNVTPEARKPRKKKRSSKARKKQRRSAKKKAGARKKKAARKQTRSRNR